MKLQKVNLKAKSWKKIMFGLIFIIIGISLMIIFIYNSNALNNRKKSFILTTGQVVGYNYDPKELKAIIKEVEVEEKIYSLSSSEFLNTPEPLETKIRLFYNPSNPTESIFESENINLIIPLSGITSFLIGLFVVFFGLISNKRNLYFE